MERRPEKAAAPPRRLGRVRRLAVAPPPAWSRPRLRPWPRPVSVLAGQLGLWAVTPLILLAQPWEKPWEAQDTFLREAKVLLLVRDVM